MADPYQKPGYGLAIILSLLLHGAVIVIGCTAWSLNRQSDPWKTTTPQPIEAQLVALKPKSQPPAQTKKIQPKRPPKVAPTRKQDSEKAKLAQQKAAAAHDAWVLKKRREAEKKKRQAEEKKRQAKAKQAAAKKRKQQQERIDQQQREQQIRTEQAQAQKQRADELTASYGQIIHSRLEQNWSVPLNARNNMQATLELSFIPTGEIIETKLISSSGDKAFDQSIIQAVKLTGIIPELQTLSRDNPRLFEAHFRHIRITFHPEGL